MRKVLLASVVLSFVSFAVRASHLSAAPAQLQVTPPPILAKGWAKTWGGSSDEAADNAAVDKWGNVYVTGAYGGTVNFDPGGGVSTHTSNGGQDVFLSKFASDGTFQWARTWGGSGRDVAGGLAVDGLGNVYVAGNFQYTVDFNPDPAITETHTSNAGSMNNIFLSKFASDGTFQWVRTWGPSDGGAEGYCVAVDGSNNVYVVGDFTGTTTNFNPWDPQHPDWHTNHPPSSGPVLFDAYLSKFDSNGNFQWARTWGGEGYDDGPGVAVDGLGDVYVAGMYASKNINFDPAGGDGGAGHPAQDSGIVVDVFLSKFDSNGTFKWVRTWGGQGTDDVAETVVVDRSNNVYVAGRFASTNCDFNPGGTPDIHSANGSLDAFVSKFDANGTFQWARTWGGTGWDAAGGLAVDGSNNVYVTGTFAGTVSFDPGGTATFTSNGGQDVFFSVFDSSGTFRWTKTWGGSGDDWGYHVAMDGAGRMYYVVGSFQGTVDFDPGSGVDNHTSNGGQDAFLSQFLLKGSKFYALTPCRLVDTRQSPDTPYLDNGGSGETRTYHFDTTIPYTGTGACSLLPTATALSLSVQFQVTDHNASLIAYPDDVTRPLVAHVVAYNTGLFYMNSAIVPTGADNGIKVFAQYGGQVVININGYFR